MELKITKKLWNCSVTFSLYGEQSTSATLFEDRYSAIQFAKDFLARRAKLGWHEHKLHPITGAVSPLDFYKDEGGSLNTWAERVPKEYMYINIKEENVYGNRG